MTIPEHDPIEVAEAGTPGTGHVHAPADPGRPDLHGVLVACLVQILPCPACARTEPCRCVRPDGYSATAERALLIESALVHYGFIPTAEEEAEFNAEEVAQWLAERSGFPRYTMQDGWRKLLESEPDVEVASINAIRRVPTGEVEQVRAAKAALLSWHQQREQQRRADRV